MSDEVPASIEELRASVIALAARVKGLSTSLDVVTEVQAAQQAVDRRAIEALEAARNAAEVAQRAENSVVPREELDARNQAEEHIRRWDRKRLLRKVYATVAVVLIFTAALGIIAARQNGYTRHTRHVVAQTNDLIFQACQNGNHQRAQTRKLYENLIAAERKVADPRDQPRTDARIAAYQQVIDSVSFTTDCGQYKNVIR